MCAAGIASAGNLLHAAPLAYSAPISAVSYSSHSTSHAAPIAYAAGPIVSKSIVPAITAYSSLPVVTKAIAPAVTYAAAAPILTKSIAPAVSYSSVSSHAGPITYAAGPVYTKAIAPAVAYSSIGHGAHLGYASSPIIAKTYSAPAVTHYAAAPVLKSAITYSAAPAVSHVSYTGLGASYGW